MATGTLTYNALHAKTLKERIKFKFKFIYLHLFSYNITTIKNKKEVQNRADYTLS